MTIDAVTPPMGRHDPARAFADLRREARPDHDFVTQHRHAKRLARIAKEPLALAPLKLFILATSTIDHLADILKLWLAFEGFDADIRIAPYRQVEQTILDPGSELHRFKPDVVWLATTYRDLSLDVTAGACKPVVDEAVAAAIAGTAALWDALHARRECHIIQNNADIPAVDLFGNFEANVPWSGRSLIRRYNVALAEACRPGVTILDFDHISSLFGKSRWVDARYWYHSKHPFNFDASGLVAFWLARQVGALKGRSRKCLVLDLDNTLWGGVIGDDGLAGIKLGNTSVGEAHADFQAYARSLRTRGVVLAVCSKNEDSIAREPFERHPDMRLTLRDIAVFRANWDNKADNLRDIAETLNIGLDSLVFVDDNPVERDLVRQFLPMVAVPEMPEDPSDYQAALSRELFFETVSFSEEDRQRSDYYQANAERNALRTRFGDLAEFQKSLAMTSTFGPIGDFQLPRAAQLINKSNQFHLTGRRYSEAELSRWLAEPGWHGLYFTLADRFGDNGLISTVLMHREGDQMHIETWCMSCRVLGRGMEEFILNQLMANARAEGCRTLVGRYVPSRKNGLVADLFPRLGFEAADKTPEATLWHKDTASANLPTQVTAV